MLEDYVFGGSNAAVGLVYRGQGQQMGERAMQSIVVGDDAIVVVGGGGYDGGRHTTRDDHGIPKCCPCPSVVFLMLPGPSVRFRVFLGGEYVCPSYRPLKFLKSAKSGRKSVRPFVNKLRNPFSPKIVKKCLKYKRCDM